MARRAAKTDANQSDIIKVFEQLGVSVEDTSGAHNGFTDIVVGYKGITVLVEIKNSANVPSKRRLTDDQVKVHDRFQGAITVVETQEQAIALVERMREAAYRIAGIDWYVGAIANAPGG